jgi:hypothetical protein
MIRPAAALGAALLVTAATACHRRAPGAASLQSCAPVDALLPTGADAGLLVGTYDVLFAATGGSEAGHQAVGRLVLRPQDPSLVSVPGTDSLTRTSHPSYGTLDVATDSIGAVRMGDAMADDARQPGVGVYVTARPNGEVTSIVARVGSASNGSQMLKFDGGHFTLHVKRVNENGVWGDWISNPGPGGVDARDARGHFCAIKQRG